MMRKSSNVGAYEKLQNTRTNYIIQKDVQGQSAEVVHQLSISILAEPSYRSSNETNRLVPNSRLFQFVKRREALSRARVHTRLEHLGAA
jgi:hypothetical protein